MLEILDSQANVGDLLEHIPIPAALISLESGEYVAINSAIGELSKYAQDIADLLLSLVLDRQNIQQLQQGKIIRDCELELPTAHDQACTLLLSAKLVSWRDERYIFCLFQDVTGYKSQKNPAKRKQVSGQANGLAKFIEAQTEAQQALAQSEQRQRAILQVIPDQIMRLHRDGTYLECLSPIPYHSSEILPPPLLPKLQEAIATALDQQSLQVYEQEIDKSGKLCVAEVRVVAVGAEEVLVLVRDISDRQIATQTQQELAHAKEITHLQRRFFAMLSHEFRTPLSTILGSVELLQHSHAQWLDDKAKRNLNRIATSVQDALELLENMLTLRYADAGNLQVKPQYINLRRFTEELVDSITTERQIVMELKTSGEDYMGYTDPFLLRRLLLNLLNNAIKYSADDTEIRVLLLINLEQDQAIWQVIDSGIGIPIADIEEIFLPWKRGSNTDNRRGTGLGLSVVQNCVNAIGGVISVLSKENVGTTFTVIVPIAGTDDV